MKYELIQLPYAPNALEPAISAETLSFHHGKHLAGYVNTLNGLIEGTEYAELPLEELVRKSEGAIFNNAGQLLNHNLYFTQFGPNKGWAWLAAKADGELVITKEPNGSNPVVQGLRPLFGVDVWEHAYYLSYQNRRADHVKDLWAIVDWDVVASRY